MEPHLTALQKWRHEFTQLDSQAQDLEILWIFQKRSQKASEVKREDDKHGLEEVDTSCSERSNHNQGQSTDTEKSCASTSMAMVRLQAMDGSGTEHTDDRTKTSFKPHLAQHCFSLGRACTTIWFSIWTRLC